MKKLILALVCLGGVALAQSGSISTALEPALSSRSPQFGVSAAVSLNITENNSASFRYGSGRTFLGGISRNIVEFLPGASLVGDVQGGMTGGHRGVILYGAGVATDLGNNVSVTYGIHVNKVAGSRMYPSAYVSVAYAFGK